ncbi:MAG TPA: ABC transporter ATP-binding protein, partial [Prolixibacteraceae bacterium]|nr:ABC transporter ATP-binding protein [Prolixibacteraceae bacterium]
AGKSTTIRILLNLIFPTSGSARILGMDCIKETKKIKQQIGYIPSDANAYTSMSIQDFLNYCMRYYHVTDGEQRIAKLADFFELDTKRKIDDLSLGNRKKVSIIQSLIHRPKVLILDEATSGLDPLMQAKFFEVLQEENRKGMTIFFSSHILTEVQLLCKRVAIIKEGKIIKLEDIETLRKRQIKKVAIESELPISDAITKINGIQNFTFNENRTSSFMYSGNMNDLVNFLAQNNIENLTIEEPSLEEIFMHYYQ